jgi:hypothetical protein
MIEGRIGMFVVETIARIRRAHFVQGKSIKAICRELRVPRKTVRKVIRSEATEFRYERDEQAGGRAGGRHLYHRGLGAGQCACAEQTAGEAQADGSDGGAARSPLPITPPR